MSEYDAGPTWTERIRRWLWLDSEPRTDHSEANRGFYTSRKPVSWRFVLAVSAVAIAIGLVILSTREAEARWAPDVGFPTPAAAVATDDQRATG